MSYPSTTTRGREFPELVTKAAGLHKMMNQAHGGDTVMCGPYRFENMHRCRLCGNKRWRYRDRDMPFCSIECEDDYDLAERRIKLERENERLQRPMSEGSYHPLAEIIAWRENNFRSGYLNCWVDKAQAIEAYTGAAAPKVPYSHVRVRSGCVPQRDFAGRPTHASIQCHCQPGNIALHREECENFVRDWLERVLDSVLTGFAVFLEGGFAGGFAGTDFRS